MDLGPPPGFRSQIEEPSTFEDEKFFTLDVGKSFDPILDDSLVGQLVGGCQFGSSFVAGGQSESLRTESLQMPIPLSKKLPSNDIFTFLTNGNVHFGEDNVEGVSSFDTCSQLPITAGQGNFLFSQGEEIFSMDVPHRTQGRSVSAIVAESIRRSQSTPLMSSWTNQLHADHHIFQRGNADDLFSNPLFGRSRNTTQNQHHVTASILFNPEPQFQSHHQLSPPAPTTLDPHTADLDNRRGKGGSQSGIMVPNSFENCGIQRPIFGRPMSTPLPNYEMSYASARQQPLPQHHSKSHSIALNLCSLEDSSVEDIVAKTCRDILMEAASHSLKAVELANTLRARVGTEVLAHVREKWGGLLSLLERHTTLFRVDRIPKVVVYQFSGRSFNFVFMSE